jgi:hypothetical protein
MLRRSNVARMGRLGALISADTSGRLLKTDITPLYDALQDLSRRIDGAGVFVAKGPLWTAFDSIVADVNALDAKLVQLDAAEVSDWQTSVVAVQQRLALMLSNLEVYTAKSNRVAIASALFALGVGGVTGVAVYRSKSAKKWAVLAGSGAAAMGGFTLWTLAHPKAP